jgi:hypothetical protein
LAGALLGVVTGAVMTARSDRASLDAHESNQQRMNLINNV